MAKSETAAGAAFPEEGVLERRLEGAADTTLGVKSLRQGEELVQRPWGGSVPYRFEKWWEGQCAKMERMRVENRGDEVLGKGSWSGQGLGHHCEDIGWLVLSGEWGSLCGVQGRGVTRCGLLTGSLRLLTWRWRGRSLFPQSRRENGGLDQSNSNGGEVSNWGLNQIFWGIWERKRGPGCLPLFYQRPPHWVLSATVPQRNGEFQNFHGVCVIHGKIFYTLRRNQNKRLHKNNNVNKLVF